jgi:hypothetical protein
MTVEEKPLAGGLWRDNPETPEGKYLVMRRDGTVVEWPNFTIGAKDPAAPAALRAYAGMGMLLGMDKAYCLAVYKLADDFEEYARKNGWGDPDRGRHRKDDPATVAKMQHGRSV